MPSKKEKLPLSVTHPELAKEAYGWDSSSISYGSDKRVEWICSLRHIWTTSISHRAINKSNCPICWGRTVLIGFNDLQSKNPELAREAYGWDPSSITASSSRKLPWICADGHIWEATSNHRTNMKSGCPVCSGKKIVPGVNDLMTVNEALGREAEGWDPSTVAPSTDKKYSWRCSLGHIWIESVNKRSRGDGCPYCSSHRVLVGFNDFGTTNPDLALEADGWDPKQYTAGSGKKVSWKCAANHRWSTPISGRTRGTGCPTCAKYGFDPNRDGYIYLIKHIKWNMQQIGITNFPEQRLESHKKLGWELLEIRGPMDGHLTQQWETAILRMLKAKGADLSNHKIAGKFDGYSEAWSKSTFEVESIKELMRLTEEFEEK